MKVFLKRKLLNKLAIFIVATMFVANIPTHNVQAEEICKETVNEESNGETNGKSIQPLTLLLDCEVVMSFSTDGLYMEFTTGSMDIASVIGVKDIKVQQKMWYGWKTVCVSDGYEYTNQSVAIVGVTFADAVKDRTYRVLATHYADYDGYEEVVNDTGAFKFTY